MKKFLLIAGLSVFPMMFANASASIDVNAPAESENQSVESITASAAASQNSQTDVSQNKEVASFNAERLETESISTTKINHEGLLTTLDSSLAHESTSHDLSVMGMYQKADWVVKSVMLLLVFASILSWTIWLVKTFQFVQAKRRMFSLKQTLKNVTSLDALIHTPQKEHEPENQLITEIDKECLWLAQSDKPISMEGVKERAAQRLTKTEEELSAEMTYGVSVLASISSTAPFIGLFGTVWGIMNSFIGIAAAKTTNLSVVAPGIAEALLATGAGLMAAIPAALSYNFFARKLADYRRDIAIVSSELMILLSKYLDDHTFTVQSQQPFNTAFQPKNNTFSTQ